MNCLYSKNHRFLANTDKYSLINNNHRVDIASVFYYYLF